MSYRWERRPSLASRLLPLLGLGLLAGLAGALALNSPRVTAVTPEAGAAGVSSLSPITITFSQPMALASVQERLSLQPAAAGEWAALPGEAAVQFTPREAWPAGATVEVSLGAGARSRLGLPLLLGRSWQFTVGRPRVAYLSEAGGAREVWAVPVEGGEAGQITHSAYGVLDFSPSPDGRRLAYAAQREDGGSDLRIVNADGEGDRALLACPGETCRAPQWSPDGTRLAFERSSPATGGGSHVWLMDVEGGTPQALAPEADVTLEARWSPDGRRLAYYDESGQQIVVNDLETGGLTLIADTSGEMGAWTQDGLALVFPEIVFVAVRPTDAAPANPTAAPDLPGFYSHLVRAEVETRDRQELSTDPAVEDASAAPSPDGAWLAFGRKFLDAARWTPGRQLWLMRPDGAEARPLTSAGDYQHSAFVWSPDSRWLVFARFDLTRAGTLPEIWALDVAGGDARLLAAGGSIPAWLP